MKKIKFVSFILTLFLITVISFGIEIHYLRLESVSFFTKILLLLPLNITIIALLTLMFFVGKSLIKLYFERKQKIRGYKFKTRIVVIFVVLTSIPALFLFILTSGLITNYIDKWFAPQISAPLESSLEIAKLFYDLERQRVMEYAKSVSAGKKPSNKDNYIVKYLYSLPDNATETIKAGFEGKAGTEIISGKNKDIVRAVIPAYSNGKRRGIILIESRIPSYIKKNTDNIKEAYESYLLLESWRVPIKLNYLLTVGFFTLIVVFMSLWIALKISQGITEPIQTLAQTTEQVASGNLNVKVEIERDDEIGYLINSFNDMVMKLKESQEKIHSAYLYIKNILDNITSGVIMLDTSGNILMINGAACRILNIIPEDVVNKNYKELISKINSTELYNLVSGIEGRTFSPVRQQIKAVLGDKRATLLVFITSLKYSDKYIGLLVVFEDITDVLEAQKALTWQDIARKIAHEIKNPLTPIKLSTERIIKKWKNKDADFGEAFERATKSIVKEVESMKRLVDSFTRFGKMPDIAKKPTNISNIINEIINLYKEYKDIELKVSLPSNPPQMEIDEEQIKRVIINIIDNAIQAMENKGVINVVLDFDILDNKALISISDTGPGIKDEDKDKLFEPYFSTKKNGMGLGLTIAKRIIMEHKGNIKVKDNKPRGSIFSIELPIKES